MEEASLVVNGTPVQNLSGINKRQSVMPRIQHYQEHLVPVHKEEERTRLHLHSFEHSAWHPVNKTLWVAGHNILKNFLTCGASRAAFIQTYE